MKRLPLGNLLRHFTALTAASLVMLCANSLFAQASSSPSATPGPESKNQRMTREAWEPYNVDNFDKAIEKADECIHEFHREAERLQAELNKTPGTPPPVGRVIDDAAREEIFSRGPLNDVATCYFIKGEAYTKLSRRAEGKQKTKYLAEATKAYEEAAKLKYARCWDPKPPGFFWDPASKANDALDDMGAKRP
jgi:hypothetical protein